MLLLDHLALSLTIMACYPSLSHSKDNESSLDVEVGITTLMARPDQQTSDNTKDEDPEQESHPCDVNLYYMANGSTGIRLEGTFRT